MSKSGQGARDLDTDKKRALTLTPVSRETEKRLDAYVDVLMLWQSKLNLVAPLALRELWTRHIADSLQLLPLAPRARVWVDFGSGGGFPGLPIACALADDPGTKVHLIESNGKKAAFLREAARATGAPAVIHQEGREIWGNLCRTGACRDGASASPTENPVRSGVSFNQPRRDRFVPERTRCRCRIDRCR